MPNRAAEDERSISNLTGLLAPDEELATTAVSVGELVHGATKSQRAADNLARMDVLSPKENQGHLFEDVQLLFDDLEKSQYKADAFEYHKTVNKNHGRLEIRECWTISDAEVLRHLRGFENWKNLSTDSRIRAQRLMGEEKSCEDRYHIASITRAKRVLRAVRPQWGIENELHWTLDIAFNEDRCRIREDHGPENFASPRHIALNLLKQEKTCKRGIKGKRLLAAWKEDYVLEVRAGLVQMGNQDAFALTLMQFLDE